MTKALTLGALVFTLLTVARPAEAHMWDWLQEWSGPGPFSSNQPMFMGSACKGDYRTSAASADAPSCLFFDYRDLKTEANDNFPIEVRVRFFDVGVKRKLAAWRLQESIEGGVAVGLMVASGDKDAGGKSAVRFMAALYDGCGGKVLGMDRNIRRQITDGGRNRPPSVRN